MNKVAVFLGHPAHFHLFKNTIKNLTDRGNAPLIIIKKKDILETLVQVAGYEYVVIRESRSNSVFGLIKSVYGMEKAMMKVIRQHDIDLLIGSTLSFATRVFKRKTVIVTGEDDAKVVPMYANLVYPFANYILTPEVCDNGRWNKKSLKYQGFHKLAYLHPKRFTPDKSIVKQYIPFERNYFLIRLTALNAHHDSGIVGITTSIAQQIIDILSPHGDIYITSERELEPQFEKYRLKINPLDIHHVMAFATLYIGDSQSMAVEAAMLGVPSIRFNDFAGKISVLEELEYKYELTFGIKTSETEKLYDTIKSLLNTPNLRQTFQSRRQKMLDDKIDVTAFFTWFIENYPESAKIIKQNPGYQYNFK